MASSLRELNPSLIWKHFDEIRKIPHCSKNEGPMAQYVLSVAAAGGFQSKKDKAGNVVVTKPASPGRENSKTVVLQGHLDMVCEKNSDVAHDFTKDPINIRIDGEWVTAQGTTLGADNGIGVAAALAILGEPNLVHGPLELLFTVDEETGLTGATMLKPDFLKGRILLNLDSEEEGAFFIGCAGGADTELVLPLVRKTSGRGERIRISLVGLRGGHSGIDIATGRGNAVQLLARILLDLGIKFDLVDLEGGSKHNAIPREAFARCITTAQNATGFKKAVTARFEQVRFEYKAVEKDMALKIEKINPDKKTPMDEASKNRFLALLVGLPHGVSAMSQEIPGLVETSTNEAIVRCEARKASIHMSSRSSILSALEALRAKIKATGVLAGAKVQHLPGYPSWTPNLQSKLLETMKGTYSRLYGKSPEVKAIHAGLECGIIGEKFPGMDMISFGPDLRHPHSPDEKVHIGSVGRFWTLLTKTLERLAE